MIGASGCLSYISMPAESVAQRSVNFILQNSSRLIRVALSKSRLDELGLPPMLPVLDGPPNHETVAVDARDGITTGVSAHDRARTIRVLATDASIPRDLVRPGHVFPAAAADGGCLVKAGAARRP